MQKNTSLISENLEEIKNTKKLKSKLSEILHTLKKIRLLISKTKFAGMKNYTNLVFELKREMNNFLKLKENIEFKNSIELVKSVNEDIKVVIRSNILKVLLKIYVSS